MDERDQSPIQYRKVSTSGCKWSTVLWLNLSALMSVEYCLLVESVSPDVSGELSLGGICQP